MICKIKRKQMPALKVRLRSDDQMPVFLWKKLRYLLIYDKINTHIIDRR